MSSTPNQVEMIYAISEFCFHYPFSDKKIQLSGMLKVYRGDCVLLQGASGSGKSTLLTALKGLIPHLIGGKLSGEILFNGQDIRNLNETDLLKIAYLQQNPDSQLICRDVFSELAFGLENQGLVANQIQEKISNIAIEFGIEHLLKREVANLSGGEKQKINLLAILLLEPEVLLLDEPTAFLDPDSANAIMEILTKYLRNTTVILVEHNLQYLEGIITRNIYIDLQGNISEQPLKAITWQQKLTQLAPRPPFAGNELLRIAKLSFSYPNTAKPLLKDINLTVYRGEIIAILGSNGTGKSTLLKLISAVLPAGPAIFWQQIPFKQFSKRQLWSKIGLLWQNPEAHFLATSVSSELNNDRQALEQINLSQSAKQSPFNLSEGQKRRLSLAIVLQNTVQLLLLDEPTFGQDLANKENLAQILNQLAMTGISFIIVSHDHEFIKALTQQIYRLKDGELIKC